MMPGSDIGAGGRPFGGVSRSGGFWENREKAGSRKTPASARIGLTVGAAGVQGEN
jgi:hypothetical protein